MRLSRWGAMGAVFLFSSVLGYATQISWWDPRFLLALTIFIGNLYLIDDNQWEGKTTL